MTIFCTPPALECVPMVFAHEIYLFFSQSLFRIQQQFLFQKPQIVLLSFPNHAGNEFDKLLIIFMGTL